MRPTLVHSSAAAPRVARARAELGRRGASEEVLVVGGTPDAASELLRAVAAERAERAERAGRGANGACFGAHRASLGRLAASLAQPALLEQNRVPVGRLAVEAVVARVVHEVREGRAAGSLGRFAEVSEGPGFARAVASAFEELRLARVGAEGLPPELASLHASYEEQLAGAGLADRAVVFALAARAAGDAADDHPLLDLPIFLVDVPIATRAERDLVEALAARTPALLATAPSGDVRTLEALEAIGFAVEALAPAAEPSSLANLQAHLFETTEPEPTSLDDGVVILSAPGEARECVEIARRLHAHARAGTPFDRMAILLRSPEEYRPHVEAALDRAGIPAHFARGAVRPDPAGRAFLALLACAAEGLSAHSFAEYLSLGQLPDATASGSPPAAGDAGDRWVAPDDELVPAVIEEALTPAPGEDPSESARSEDPDTAPVTAGTLRAPRRWEALLVDAAVIGGIDRWARRLDGLEERLRLDLADLDDPHAAGVARIERQLRDLDALRDYALPLLHELSNLPDEGAWGDWLDALSALATRALRDPRRVLACLSELAPMAAVGPVSLAEVQRVLSRRLLELTRKPGKTAYGKVTVAPCDGARGLDFDVVFVPGLAEKLFPKQISEDPIVPDALRVQLGAGLPTNAERVERERLALRLAVGAASRSLVLSYPRLDLEKSRPRVPSFYGLEALRAAEGALPGFDELQSRAERVADARVGWPAPARAEDAIDEAEHDLAQLDRILDLDEGESRGAAVYLLNANPYLRNALRARARRWHRAWTYADGLLETPTSPVSDAAREALAKQQLTARSFSPTALQHFARCPYKFFLQAVLRLAPRDEVEPIDELPALERGSLVHETQFRLFGRLRDAGLLPVTPVNVDRARDVLDATLTEVADEYRDDLAPAIERVWEDGIAAIRADLREWLRRASVDEAGFVPAYFELAFGLPGRRERDPHSVAEPVEIDCGLRLRGSIDLVERTADGRLRATDHKTGKERFAQGEIVRGGEALQPVLYALAAEKLFPDDAVESGRLYYCTSAGGFAERVVALDGAARESAAAVASAIDSAVSTPFLPAYPEERACLYCDYNVVCGPYEELRTSRKYEAQAELEPLRALRGLR